MGMGMSSLSGEPPCGWDKYEQLFLGHAIHGRRAKAAV